MPSWIDTKNIIDNRHGDFDSVRRERIREIEKITGRPLLVYASDFLNQPKVAACHGEVSIDGNDKIGFIEVIAGIPGNNLDILIQSPGGEPGAAEAIIELLRSRFSSIRFFVPDQAKSAATMMCCAGDELLMDERSELGPIDPQMLIRKSDNSSIFAPAQAILSQFDKAKESIAKNPEELPAWLPILQSYAPSLLSVCEDADTLSKSLVAEWLKKYMFRGAVDSEIKANKIANFLADSKIHLSHGRRIGIEALQKIGINISDLRENIGLRDKIWDLYLAIKWTFELTPAYKIIENGNGAAYIRLIVPQEIKLRPGIQLPTPQLPLRTNTPEVKPQRKRHR